MMEKRRPSNFLHGILEATIFRATASNPSFSLNCACLGDKPAYVTIKIGETTVAETSHETGRVWNQSFRILCAHPGDATLTLTLRTRLNVLGKIRIPASDLLMEADHKPIEPTSSSFPLLTKKGKRNPKLKLQFALRFLHAELEPDWGVGLGRGGFEGLVDGVTFPQRSGCTVTLYQDAHHRHGFQPPITLGNGQLYRPRRLWEDVFRAIHGAKHLIYIAGWSLNPKKALVRDIHTEIPRSQLGIELGELLKQKAEEGVAVRIMLWDDETSLPVIKNQGVMRTHDEDAFNYFKHTKVVCRLCPRLHHHFPTLFTHHQKTITVDASPQLLRSSGGAADATSTPGNEDDREIISFVGGLDLCDGRYNTEEHPLFRALTSEAHADDFYQTSIAGASLRKGGPREPWHDAHACVAGEAAHDVLANFEQRWAKQQHRDPSFLVPIPSIPNLVRSSEVANGSSPTGWTVQVFRSIDEISAAELPHNISVERSIHDAYVHAIRRAERFIYIENQYFIGGCHLWAGADEHSGCKNLIPIEIALKVASKIRARERFTVYVVMPMWPEGAPESDAVQDILHWTRLTMATMYRLVATAVGESGADAHPKDYLNFFCLANREEKVRGEFVPPCSPPHGSHYWKAQESRRFMIYVHSKLMIVDDEYVLIGSANVNQRSMDGERDTEIAVGCYQPRYTGESAGGGDIHAYRMSLWYEHTGVIEAAFMEPESVECVRRLRRIGEEMWKVYSGEGVVDMGGVHLVSYPIDVSDDGSIGDHAEGSGGTFPDTTALIKGRRSKILPPVFTT